ncbi:hypothetical protein [Desulforamulus profundi]|uniref:hypothetical protein n=1 Tax=Desulforamulus profundi TaxID=1383067 RepID=UPI001EE5589E|nr:hypothetical protein [Desulforamulus profundi]
MAHRGGNTLRAWLVREELIRQVEPLRQRAQSTAALAMEVLDRSLSKGVHATKYL